MKMKRSTFVAIAVVAAAAIVVMIINADAQTLQSATTITALNQ
jgi:hypothetical protein